MLVLFYQKNLEETPEPIIYEGPWKVRVTLLIILQYLLWKEYGNA